MYPLYWASSEESTYQPVSLFIGHSCLAANVYKQGMATTATSP